jgi:hypothetical protein
VLSTNKHFRSNQICPLRAEYIWYAILLLEANGLVLGSFVLVNQWCAPLTGINRLAVSGTCVCPNLLVIWAIVILMLSWLRSHKWLLLVGLLLLDGSQYCMPLTAGRRACVTACCSGQHMLAVSKFEDIQQRYCRDGKQRASSNAPAQARECQKSFSG